jgi:hypothetical protein
MLAERVGKKFRCPGFMIITVYGRQELFCNVIRRRGGVMSRADMQSRARDAGLFTSLDSRASRRRERFALLSASDPSPGRKILRGT